MFGNNKKFKVIVLTLLIFGVFVGLAAPMQARAEFSLIDFGQDLIMKTIAGIVHLVMFVPAHFLLWVAALSFDFALNVSIVSFHNYANMPVITDAWMIGRDIANMVFIFLMLYIAIATILQISGYNIQSLLFTVVLIALLINFSMMITKVIIDASNVFALEFYNKMTMMPDGTSTSLSATIAGELKVNNIFKMYDADPAAAVKDQVSGTGVILGLVGGAVVMFVTAGVLFSFTFMFIIRTVVLLFLIILSPLAFIGMALPHFKSSSKEWWDTLFAQSLLAPASMFMLYLVVRIMTSGSLASQLGVNSSDGIMDLFFVSVGDSGVIKFFIYYIILIAFIQGSLQIAKKMAATGSKGVYDYGDKADKWVKGKARGYGNAVKDVAKRQAKIYGGKMVGGFGDKMKEWSEAKYDASGGKMDRVKSMAKFGVKQAIGKTVRGVGKVTNTIGLGETLGLGAIESAGLAEEKKRDAEYKKKYGGRNVRELEAAHRASVLPSEKRAIQKLIEEKKKGEDAKKAKKVATTRESNRYGEITGQNLSGKTNRLNEDVEKGGEKLDANGQPIQYKSELNIAKSEHKKLLGDENMADDKVSEVTQEKLTELESEIESLRAREAAVWNDKTLSDDGKERKAKDIQSEKNRKIIEKKRIEDAKKKIDKLEAERDKLMEKNEKRKEEEKKEEEKRKEEEKKKEEKK